VFTLYMKEDDGAKTRDNVGDNIYASRITTLYLGMLYVLQFVCSVRIVT
jgi:hypothetical protein